MVAAKAPAASISKVATSFISILDFASWLLPRRGISISLLWRNFAASFLILFRFRHYHTLFYFDFITPDAISMGLMGARSLALRHVYRRHYRRLAAI